MYRLVDKVLSGTASPAEKAQLEEWLNADVKHREEYEDLKTLWNYSKESDVKEKDPNFYEGLNRIKEIIELRRRTIGKRDWKTYIAVLALVISIVALVYSCFSYIKSYGNEKPIKIENRPLAQVFELIQKKYQVTFHVTNKEILTCPFTGTFNATAGLEDVLSTISRSTGLDLKKEVDARIKVSGTSCK